MRRAYNILATYLKGEDHLEDRGVDDWMILKSGMGCRLDLSGLGYGPVESSCEYGNGLSGPIRGGEFLDKMDEFRLSEGLCSVILFITLSCTYMRMNDQSKYNS
jgi:hypothetical protein